MAQIHPTAIVDPKARLADDVVIGPGTVIGPHVSIGPGTGVGAHCVIENRTTIGANNRIGHHVCLGSVPQDLKYKGENSTCEIGDDNDLREFVTMHIGTENGGGSTTLGSHNLVMVGSHIAHDSHVRNHCILSNNAMLAGHVIIDDHAILSGGTAVSHFVTIGRYAFIGGLAGVVHDCPPFLMSDGHPARARAVNTIGLARHGFDETVIDKLKRVYLGIYGQKARKLNCFSDTIGALEKEYADDATVLELINFIARSAETPNGRFAETNRPDNKRAAPTR
ncbi:MAG: acyl-ACP--UDP-N-acetylglucosamine O-acyltransferase [Planctomycetota bacterium]|jgi:UDP-N-acetylglucosamine acyltransferase